MRQVYGVTDNEHPQGPQQVTDFVSVFGPNGRKIIQHSDLMSYTSLTPMEHNVNYIVIYTYYRRIHEIAIKSLLPSQSQKEVRLGL